MSTDIERVPGLGWFFARWKNTINRLDKGAIELSVRELEMANPGCRKEKLARQIVRSAARNAGFVGLATAAPALVPGIGTAVSIIGIVPEEIYLIHRQCELVLRLASLYGFDLYEEERLYEVIMLAGTPSRSIEAFMTVKSDLRHVASRAAAHVAGAAGRGTTVGAKTASRSVFRRLPALGFFIGGALNYYTFKILGKKTATFYKRLENEYYREIPLLPENT